MFSWKETKLSDLGRIEKHPTIKFSSFGKQVNFVPCRNFKGHLYVDSVTRYLDKDLIKKPFPINTVCIKTNGIVNIYTLILKKPAYLFSTMAGFIPFHNVSDSLFIKYYFDSSIIKQKWKKLVYDNNKTNDTISKKILKSLSFPVPSFEIQQKIGEIILNYDLQLGCLEKQVSLLRSFESNLLQFRGIGYLIELIQKKIAILKSIKIEMIDGIYGQIIGVA